MSRCCTVSHTVGGDILKAGTDNNSVNDSRLGYYSKKIYFLRQNQKSHTSIIIQEVTKFGRYRIKPWTQQEQRLVYANL